MNKLEDLFTKEITKEDILGKIFYTREEALMTKE